MATKKAAKKVLTRKVMKSTKGGDGNTTTTTTTTPTKSKAADKAFAATDAYIRG